MPFGITTNNRANVAFKNLLGRSQTRDINDLGNEPFGTFISSPSKVIWTSDVPTSRWDGISQGVAVEIDADLILHATSAGHGYSTHYPTIPPTGIDPKTNLSFVYGNGSLVGIVAGDRTLDIIPPTFNVNGGQIDDFASGYTPMLYSDVDMLQAIDLLDDRDWIYQFQSGVYFEETLKSPTPLKIKIWKYIGNTLEDNLSDDNYLIVGFTGNTTTVTHNFGVYPNVTILDSEDYEIEGSIKNNNVNEIIVDFNNYGVLNYGNVICIK